MQFVRNLFSCLRRSWPGLVAADLLYKILAFVLLTPLLALLFRTLLSFSGHAVLSDTDIAIFFAGPFGWFCAIVLGTVWLGIVALEQSSLLWILATQTSGRKPNVLASLRFAMGNAARILRVTARLVGWSLIAIAPFLAVAGGVYFWLLSDYDINYYLAERPSEFKLALAIGLFLFLLLAGVLLRLYSSWFLVLPLVLFQNLSPKTALEESARRVGGYRYRVVVWLTIWVFVLILANVALTFLIGGAGRLLIPDNIGSLPILATRIGLMLLVMAIASLAINLIGTIGFAGMLMEGYRLIDPDASESISDNVLTDETGQEGITWLSRWRLTIASVIGVLVAALIGYTSLNSVHLVDDAQVMAHRGASYVAPENTMAAFRQAIADGADWIEIDIQETADGEVVVLHDSDFMKLSGNPLKIWDAKLEELSDIDVGSWFDPKFSEERVPTLQEVLQLCKDKVGLNIELKYYGHDQQLEQRMVDLIDQEGMADQVMIMSLKPEGVAKTKALRPDWKCGLLLSVYVGNLEKIEADFLAVNSRFATRRFVNRAHEIGKQVFVWTVNDEISMSQAMNRRVDGILTDRPGLAKTVLAQRAEMSNAERLLIEIAILLGRKPPNIEP